uniref:Uncharacterized protein n=1 Tax=Rhizochromulina marina TaxID=1034831 RepID=A0A7S2RQR3_9STRA|mmetsp:Transcript_19661/g.57399  ORF Transcript_19661/g.57399 Transcript_19661/m.57399 type:complete len:181 (+) Transcript_19661:329-871(+)
MLNMTRSLSETNLASSVTGASYRGVGAPDDEDSDDEDSEAALPTERAPRKANSDSAVTTEKLQSRCHSLEEEVQWLKGQVVGLNKTIEILANTVNHQLALDPAKMPAVAASSIYGPLAGFGRSVQAALTPSRRLGKRARRDDAPVARAATEQQQQPPSSNGLVQERGLFPTPVRKVEEHF